MFWRILRVLMWKHWLTRKRKWSCTIVELVVPAMFFIPSFLARVGINEEIPESSRYQKQEFSLWKMSEPVSVFYSPETNFTRALMAIVAQKLNMKLLNKFPEKKYDYMLRGYLPFRESSNIARYSTTMGPDEAIVVFHNVSDGQPEKLNYSITMRTPFNKLIDYYKAYYTEALEKFNDIESHDQFLRLQWAIDSSFIQMLTGKEVKQRVTLQENPERFDDEDTKLTMKFILKMFFVFTAAISGVVPIFYGFMSRIITEKSSGVQELMEMMGVTPFPLALSHVLNACVPGLIFALGGTFFMKFGEKAFFEHSSAYIIFLGFFLHFLTMIFTALVFSYIGRKTSSVDILLIGTYTFATLPAIFMLDLNTSPAIRNGLGLVLSMPLLWILKQIAYLEVRNNGLTFDNISTSHYAKDGSALRAIVYMLIQILISCLLCWYLERVVSGVYGTALPWNFLCRKEYWSKKKSEPNVETTQVKEAQDPKYFEPPPNLEAGIRAIHVTKDYPKNPGALDDLSLDVYKGEITVLLGHNGAGKSTLMAVITGLTNPTKGKVLVNGYDIMLEKGKARSYIGLCPQHNMFLDHVSVREHIMFFALIKRGTFKEARVAADKLLEQLSIQGKADNTTSELSGGMKRRLQLGCALAGEASVLLLDEPTAGVDVETRRSLWDLLLSLRGSRTVLLSTHFMEEADALGDRVAAMHAGHLRSNATPMYLKRSLATGYRLTLSTTGAPNEAALTSTVQSVLPNATVKEVTSIGVSYNLPIENTGNYPALFSKLENKKDDLGIESISVGVSTLEEVFLKLCSGTDSTLIEGPKIKKAPVYNKLTGFPLCRRQFVELVKRYLRFLWIYKYTQILFGIVLIVILIFLTMHWANDKTPNKPSPEGQSKMYLSTPLLPLSDKYNRTLGDQFPNVHFDNVTNISAAAMGRSGRTNHSDYVLHFGEKEAKVFYKKSGRSGPGAALNLLSNVLIARAQPLSKDHTITALNKPFTHVYPTNTDLKSPKTEAERDIWIFMTTIAVLMGLSLLMSLPPKDYHSGTRANHIMAGCSPELHWGTMFLLSTFQVVFIYGLAIVISCVALERNETFNDASFLIAVLVSLMLGSLSILTTMCYETFSMSETWTMGYMSAMTLGGVVIIPMILKIKQLNRVFVKRILKIIVPPYAFYSAMSNCADTAALNALCTLNRKLCPQTDYWAPQFVGACCGFTSNPVSYFSMDGIGEDIIILFCQFVSSLIFLLLCQRGVELTSETFMAYWYKPTARMTDDIIIKQEQSYVQETIKRPITEIKDQMLVSDIHKNYAGCLKSFNAVKGVSFSVKKGECFGLLGVNGAGKSTVFQMITVANPRTKGQIYSNGHFLKPPCVKKYLRSLSYCPQFEGLDHFLTGRQNLQLLLACKGLSRKDADTEAQSWIRLVDLFKYSDRLVAEYSGGCKRRMATAAALCTGAPTTLLDEPTAGVDVAARRAVWFALKRALKERRALIITSHSLDEMEMLCHRIAMMAAGQICALGTPAFLKSTYATGHSVVFNLKHLTDDDEIRIKKVNQLKQNIEKAFNCVLKDQHRTMLHYHINVTMPYSILFEYMEDLKKSSSELIQDYSVSETTLEEVFLSFAKLQEEQATLQKQKSKVTFKDDKEAKKKSNEKASSSKENKKK